VKVLRGRATARRFAADNRASAIPAMLLVGLLGGVVAGFAAWSLAQRRYRRSLFHPHPLRRLAAVGYLRAHPSVDSARLLQDYLQWERHPRLRRRARLALSEMERMLGS
jgi:hypothetical protein